MFHLSSKALYRQPVVTDLGLRNSISLFPIFDGAGTTRQLGVVSENPARIYLVNWRPGLVTKRLLRPLQLNISLQALEEASEDEARAATGWWHFDPWWLLTEKNFLDHPATPWLSTTNAAREFKKVSNVFFRRDLSAITTLGGLNTAGQWEYRAYQPSLLPEREVAPPEENTIRATGWRLRPFWDRDGENRRGRHRAVRA